MTEEPSGTKPRNYRVLAVDGMDENGIPTAWHDFGVHAGRNRDQAFDAAAKIHLELKDRDRPMVAIPETSFEIIVREVEVVETEVLKPYVPKKKDAPE